MAIHRKRRIVTDPTKRSPTLAKWVDPVKDAPLWTADQLRSYTRSELILIAKEMGGDIAHIKRNSEMIELILKNQRPQTAFLQADELEKGMRVLYEGREALVVKVASHIPSMGLGEYLHYYVDLVFVDGGPDDTVICYPFKKWDIIDKPPSGVYVNGIPIEQFIDAQVQNSGPSSYTALAPIHADDIDIRAWVEVNHHAGAVIRDRGRVIGSGPSFITLQRNYGSNLTILRGDIESACLIPPLW